MWPVDRDEAPSVLSFPRREKINSNGRPDNYLIKSPARASRGSPTNESSSYYSK